MEGFKRHTLNTAEDVQQHALQHRKDLVIVLLDLHLHIKTGELGECKYR